MVGGRWSAEPVAVAAPLFLPLFQRADGTHCVFYCLYAPEERAGSGRRVDLRRSCGRHPGLTAALHVLKTYPTPPVARLLLRLRSGKERVAQCKGVCRPDKS